MPSRWLTFALLPLFAFACHKKTSPKMPPITPVSSQSDGPGVRRAMARALMSQYDYEQATSLLRQALKEEGGTGNAQTRMLLGVCLRELRFYPEAEAELTLALGLDSQNPETWNAMGILQQMSGKDKEATQAFREACRLSPNTAEYHNNLGFSLYLSEEYQEAAEELRRAVIIAPNINKYRNNLGFALGALGKDEDAKEAFLAAGTPAQAENNLGVIYERRGDLSRANAAYEEALSLDPTLLEAQRNFNRLQGDPK